MGGTEPFESGEEVKESLFVRLERQFVNARKLWRDFMGDSAYERYVERHKREHPDHAPLSEREFWRARRTFDETNHSTGCC